MIKSTIKNRFIILGAGKNKAWDENPSLAAVDNTATFMNWQIETSHILHCHKVDYVGGYHLNEITQLLPANITVTHNPLWRETGALYSLLLLDFSPDENLYISYNDIALDDLFVKNLMHNDNLVCLADFSFPKRYGTNTYHCETIHNYQQQTGEFVGFLKIPQRLIPILNALKNNKDNYKQQFLSDLILHFMTTHIPIDFINAENHWCDINLPKERAQFILRGKARSLANLKKLTTQSYFLPQIYFSCEEWQKDPQKVHQRTKEKINSDLVIIRSSAAAEDNFSNSQAGAFKSEAGVSLNSYTNFSDAVHSVMATYPQTNADDFILVQPYIQNAILHGVVFTQTHDGGPYYIFNYQFGNNTEAVTQGTSSKHQTVYFYEKADLALLPTELHKVFNAIQEIEKLLHYHALDIEFIVDNKDKCFILQVRPQVSHKNFILHSKEEIYAAITAIKSEINLYEQNKADYLQDVISVWAVMPDWNPAEIIGRKPNTLALSLYQVLVTDATWAQQRLEFGYKDLRNYPLMKNFYGLPYIDVKASFLSFVPYTINTALSKKIVNLALSYLQKNPQLHDKVEFSVMPTCYRFDFDKQYQHILQHLTPAEIIEVTTSYKQITLQAIRFDSKKSNYQPLEKLAHNTIENIKHLISNCQKGVLAFAHEARKAFVATNLLQSLVTLGALSEQELHYFYSSIQTIAKQFASDAFACQQGKISKTAFIHGYGHLRPGTYDITAPRYDTNPELFLEPLIQSAIAENIENFTWHANTQENIEKYLKTLDQNLDFVTFIQFAKEAISAREFVKYTFTKDLSAALEMIAAWGEEQGLSRDQMAMVDCQTLLSFDNKKSSDSIEIYLQNLITINKKNAGIRACLEMPILFSSPNELDCFYYPHTMPNYITQEKIIGNVFHLNKNFHEQFENTILFIENADPGYDWIFSKKIKGFVTMYGGINSHMAVRAAECNMPAVIGIGEKLFNQLVTASAITIDCHHKTIYSV